MRIVVALLPALLIATALLPATPARAEPALLLEDAKLEPLGGAPEGGFGRAVAIDGDVAVVTANIGSFIPDTTPEEIGAAAYVFERQSNGTWRQTAKLLPDGEPGRSGLFGHSVAVEGRTIVVGAPFAWRLYVFEDSGAGWTRTALLQGPNFGVSVAIENGVIATGSDTPHGLRLFGRVGNGWAQIASFANGSGNAGGSDYRGPRVDITGNHAIHGSPGDHTTDPELPELVYIYTRPPSGDWSAASVSTVGPANINRNVRISGDAAVIGGAIYERGPTGWRALEGEVAREMDADIDGSLVVGSIGGVRQRTAAGEWPAAAQLIAGDGSSLGSSRVSGRRTISNADHRLAAYVHDIPSDLERAALQQDDFQDGNAGGWSPITGIFSVVASAGSLVYRQASTAGNATSLLPAAYGTDQTIQADIRPVSFNGADRWFGLAVRYIDANNHYYVTARSSNVIQLKKIVNGSVQTLGSSALSVAANRNYRLRLEAIGQRLRLLVDDKLLLEARDGSLLQGQPGVLMYKTAADYDNVLWGGNPLTTLFRRDFEPDSSTQYPVTLSPPGWRIVSLGSGRVLEYPLTDGGASAVGIVGASSNGSASVTARATAFNGTDRWFGLAARYIDAQNYHYLTVRNSNTVMLRKLVNGTIRTLDTASFTVSTNTWYRLRLDVIGQSVRGYINGRLVLEANDPDLPSNDAGGRTALLLYKTAAQYDNWQSVRP